MIPVRQTKRGGPDVPPEERGDCLPAVLASVLEVPIDAVPIPHSDDVHWWDATQAALEPHGYRLVVADPAIWPDTYWLAGVPSLNLGPGVRHIIVMRSGEVAHDPCLGRRYEPGTPVSEVPVQDAYVLVPLAIRSLAA